MVLHTTGTNTVFGEGVPSAYGWSRGGVIQYGNNPHGLVRINPWGVIFRAQGNPPSSDVLVKVGDLSLDVLSSGAWSRWSFLKRVDGDLFDANFAGDPVVRPTFYSVAPNFVITEIPTENFTYHFWVNRVPIDLPIEGIIVSFTAKLVSKTGADISDQVGTLLAQSGCDFKAADGSVIENSFTGRMTPITTSLRRFYGTTLDADQLVLYPPPADLALMTQTDEQALDAEIVTP